MNSKEDFLFWSLANYFVTQHDYRLLQMKGNDWELWLENTSNKEAKIIRILRQNVDWSNWMQRDIETIANIAERYRKRFIRSELQMINLYITPYPPVDDYRFRIEKAYQAPGSKKTNVHTMLIQPSQLESSLEQLSELLKKPIAITLEEDYETQTILALKQTTLEYLVKKAKQEKAIFQNGKPRFTYVFLVVQIAILLLMEIMGGSTNSATLIKFGAKFNPLILEGEWWRFFTPIFLHIGFLHLFMNSLALFYLGPLVERIFGNARFIVIYLFAGFLGSLASFVTSPNLSAGASGAIFGCFGALLYFGVMNPKLFFRTMGANILFVIGLNLVFGFTVQGIDNAGHIGGLVGGFLAAGITHFPKLKKPLLQVFFTVASAAIVFFGLQYGYGETTKVLDSHSSFVLAQMYVEKEEYEQAYSVLKDVQASGDKSADLLFLLSYVEIQKGMTSQAEDHLMNVVEIDPNFHEAFYNLALLNINNQELIKAKENAMAAYNIEPDRKEYKDLLNEINGYLTR
ncbi:rhomboid family protein [Bacillus marasmi]|uniref:rhomboid family protein n=1 Tax=Bacillus marasmi TaxID=1926279 RepID=UPI0011CA2C9B|nr:rhomboid family intramembrane serine protease [Bacillus marasmi]